MIESVAHRLDGNRNGVQKTIVLIMSCLSVHIRVHLAEAPGIVNILFLLGPNDLFVDIYLGKL